MPATDPENRATNAITTVAPTVGAIQGVSVLPGMAALTGPAIPAAAMRIGGAIQTSAYGDAIMAALPSAAKFVEPFVVPGPPDVTSKAGMAGWVIDKYLELKRQKK